MCYKLPYLQQNSYNVTKIVTCYITGCALDRFCKVMGAIREIRIFFGLFILYVGILHLPCHKQGNMGLDHLWKQIDIFYREFLQLHPPKEKIHQKTPPCM